MFKSLGADRSEIIEYGVSSLEGFLADFAKLPKIDHVFKSTQLWLANPLCAAALPSPDSD